MDSTMKRPRAPDVGRFSSKSRQAKLLVQFDAKPSTDYEATCRVVNPLDGYQTRFEGCRRRCSDLRTAGFLEDSGKRRANPGALDAEAIVWQITETGRLALRRLLSTGWSR